MSKDIRAAADNAADLMVGAKVISYEELMQELAVIKEKIIRLKKDYDAKIRLGT